MKVNNKERDVTSLIESKRSLLFDKGIAEETLYIDVDVADIDYSHNQLDALLRRTAPGDCIYVSQINSDGSPVNFRFHVDKDVTNLKKSILSCLTFEAKNFLVLEKRRLMDACPATKKHRTIRNPDFVKLVHFLKEEEKLTASSISRMLGVNRQMVFRALLKKSKSI
jgi:hypothetical protein